MNEYDEEDRKNDVHYQEREGHDVSELASASIVCTPFPDLHHGEEGRIEVSQHVVANVDIELEMREHSCGPRIDFLISGVKLANEEENNMDDHKEPQQGEDPGEGLGQTIDREIVVTIILVEEVSVIVCLIVEEDEVGNESWLECIIHERHQAEVVDRHERNELKVFDQDPDGDEADLAIRK